jgi:hypothetical protein
VNWILSAGPFTVDLDMYGLGDWDRGKTFIFGIMSRLALGSSQPPVQWVGGGLHGALRKFPLYTFMAWVIGIGKSLLLYVLESEW